MEKLRPARWRLWQSAGYGLVFGAVVGGLTVATTSNNRWSAESIVGTIGGQLLFGVVLFVIVASIRNAVLGAR